MSNNTALSREQRERMLALVADLRSGKHQQARYNLRKDAEGSKSAYCCLGRACAISKLGKWKRNADYDWEYVVDRIYDDVALPEAVREYYGFPDHCGFATEAKNGTFWLTDLNDNHFTFAQIADLIVHEYNLDTLSSPHEEHRG